MIISATEWSRLQRKFAAAGVPLTKAKVGGCEKCGGIWWREAVGATCPTDGWPLHDVVVI